jgi:hypothetical protein
MVGRCQGDWLGRKREGGEHKVRPYGTGEICSNAEGRIYFIDIVHSLRDGKIFFKLINGVDLANCSEAEKT